MSFDSFNGPSAWAIPASSQPGDIVTEALKKEKVLKEIAASQEDLKALYSRVQSVQKEVNELHSGNETLQMYIDNLTVQMAKRR
ncbi:MAG: hypothetical protein NXY57DRAFT_972801 [Lentinula lateritia]|uniref:Uncharacterized protein n=1 Tax=Lentinula lateritia TaxID=40482 RepID=A0ABQ8VYM3_9AGAR|nr:hypothetical protein EV359DRAFT_31426 [Lentinula novae-zelandiae]KAJ3935101.1 MAG: hypothetical protein NXY57DRAFT_972801 [Lentinula lateritia]KAJ4501486.1 hypothetical protein C8R41DRAFT_913486 [Lentinula lateritia]